MASLFIDTTSTLKIGLLSSNYDWISFKDTLINKTAQYVHIHLYNLLKENNLSLTTDINEVFIVIGPGSYTGLRIAKGLMDILRWQKIKVFSFYLHKIPRYLNFEKGVFVANAFKKQIFRYSWSSNQESSELVTEFNAQDEKNVFSSELDKFEMANNVNDLILNKPNELFKFISLNKLMEPILYFRKIEEEFRATCSE